MRPSNFPERLNQKRMGALARLAGIKPDVDTERAKSLAVEIAALNERIVGSARSVRTKKAGGHIERLARSRSPAR